VATTSPTQEASQAGLAAIYAFRIRVAVTGVVLIILTLLTSFATWISDAPSTGVENVTNWDLWVINGGRGSNGAVVIDSSAGGPASGTAILLIVTLLLALATATEASWVLALATAVSGVLTFALILVLRGVALSYSLGGPHYYAAGGGLNGALVGTALLVIWAVAVLRGARLQYAALPAA
jgi:hypothetical protein